MESIDYSSSLITQITQQLQKLPTPLQRQVLDFVNFLATRQVAPPTQTTLPPGTLTGLHGLLKHHSGDLSDTALKDDQINYLLQKHQ